MSAQPAGPAADPRSSPREAMRGLPSRAVVDLGAIRDNVAALAAHAGPAAVMAVVKADGYGHGLLPSARAARRAAARPGSASPSSARRWSCARRGSTVPVLSWLHVPGSDFAAAIAADVDLSVSALWALEEVAAGARAARPHRPGPPQGRHRAVPQRRVRGRLAGAGRRGAQAGGRGRRPAWSGSGRTSPTPTRPHHPTVRLQQERFVEAVALARAGRLPAGGAAPGQLGRHPDQPRRPLRPGPSRPRGLRPVAGAGPRRPGAFGLTPAMTLRAPTSRWSSGCPPARASPTATSTSPRGRRRSRWCRSATPTASRATRPTSGPVADRRSASHRRRAGLHGPVRRRRRAPSSRCDPARRSCSSVAAATASRRPQDWADGDRDDLLRDRHPHRRPRAPDLRWRRAVSSPRRRTLTGLGVGLVAAGATAAARRGHRPAGARPHARPGAGRHRLLRRRGRQGAGRPRRRRRAAARRGRRAPGRRAGAGRGAHGRLLPRLHPQPAQLALPAAGPDRGRLPRRGLGPARPRSLGHREQGVGQHRPARPRPGPRDRRGGARAGRSCWSGTRWAG